MELDGGTLIGGTCGPMRESTRSSGCVVVSGWQLTAPVHRCCQAIEAFLSQYFGTAGSDILPWTPPDWTPSPPLLATIVNTTLQQWASDVNVLWKLLGKQVRMRHVHRFMV